MNWFVTILILLFSMVPFASLGYFFFRRNFFTSFILGLSISGLIVAILANFNASLIRPAIVIIMVVGLLGGLLSLKQIRFNKTSSLLYCFILLLGVLIVYLNFPTNAFISDGKFVYDLHYQYYANLPTEMLLADYQGRLRVMDFFAFEWTRYHFFNSAVQASFSGLISNPGLLTYLIAQLIITTAILLSLIENLLGYFGLNLKTGLAVILWLIIGFTFFGGSLTWNLATTGPLSVFAIVLFIFSIYLRDYKMAFIYSVVLGASAFRLLPVSLLLAVFSLVLLIKTTGISWKSFGVNRLAVILMVLLFDAYNVITLATGRSNGPDKLSSFFTLDFKTPFDDGWSAALGFYQTYGAGTIFFLKNEFYTLSGGLMPKVFEMSYPRWALLGLVLMMIAGALVAFKFANRRIKIFSLIGSLAAIAIFYTSTLGVRKVILLALSYTIAAAVFAALMNKAGKKEKSNILIVAVFLVIAVTTYLQFCFLSLAVKAPIMLIGFDVLLWSLVGLVLLYHSSKKHTLWLAMVVAALMLNIYQFPINAITRIKSPSKNTIAKNSIDITELSEREIRSRLVNGKQCAFTFDSPAKQNLYQAILGCRLDREPNENQTESLNARFAGKKVKDE